MHRASPPSKKTEAAAGSAYLDTLSLERHLKLTFLSPSAMFEEGPHTGTFCLGRGVVPAEATGKSWISSADFAIAIIDELETLAHSRQRFTVGD